MPTEPTRGAQPGFTPDTVLLFCGGIYIGALVLFFLLGEGILAGYLTLPGGFLAYGLANLVPIGTPLNAVLMSVAGNVLLLIVGAAINVVSAYLILRLLLVRRFGKTSHQPPATIDRRPHRAWWKPPRWVWLWGALYVAWITNLAMDGATQRAAYFALPAGWVVLGVGNVLAMGNLPAFAIAGATNALVIFLSFAGVRRVLERLTAADRADTRG